MLDVDMGDFFPQHRGQRIRARLVGKRVVPWELYADLIAQKLDTQSYKIIQLNQH